MSLKAFHVFFVAVAILLALSFGVWGVRDYRADGDRTSLLLGVASFASSLILAIYGYWFLKKLKKFSYV